MAGVGQVAAWRRDIETEASWPGSAPTDPGTGHRIPMVSEAVIKNPRLQDRGVLFGQVSEEEAALAGFDAGGPVECDLRYGDLDRMYAAAMGFENPNTDAAGGSPHNLTAGEERHVYECHQDLRSLVWASGDRAASTGTSGQEGHWLTTHRKQCRGQFCVSKGVSDFRLWPAMINSMEFNITPTSSRVSFGLVGYNLEAGDYGSASYTSYGGQDYNDDPGVSQVMLHQLTAKWGSEAGSTWVDSNMGITELTVRLDNGLKADDFDAAGGQYILEPWRSAQRVVSGSFVITRYAHDLFQSWADSDIAAMLQFDFAGPSLGTNNAGLTLGIPGCKFTSISQPVGGPDIIQQTVEFQAHAAASLHADTWTGPGQPFENVTLTQNANGKPGELLIATVNEYDENVFEND